MACPIEHNLTRWRNGQEPEYEAWRERYLERGLTDMELELLQWIICAGVSFLNLIWDFNEWTDTRRKTLGCAIERWVRMLAVTI